MPESEAFVEKDNFAADFDEVTKDTLVGSVGERWTHATTELRPKIEESAKAWDYMLCNQPSVSSLALEGQKDKYVAEAAKRKGLRFPHIPIAVESILALQHNTTFPQDDRFFRGNPVNTAAEENQELIEQFIAENIGVSNTAEELRRLRLNLILDGTACLFTRWKVKKNPRKFDYEPKTLDIPTPVGTASLPIPFAGLRKVKDSDIEWEGTEVIALDFNDWRVDPAARCMDESWFIRRWYMPVHQAKKEYPGFDVQPYSMSLPNSEEAAKREAQGLRAIDQLIDPDFESEGKKHVLMMACYDDFVINDELYENHVAIVMNGRELVWFGPNPYNHGLKPYIVAPYIAIPGQIYGQSAVVHAIPVAEAYDKAVDNMLRSSTWAGNPVILKNISDPGVRQHKNKRVHPGVELPVSDPNNAYKQLPIGIANLDALLQLMQNSEDKLNKVIGNSPFVEGGQPEQGRVSAFEIDARMQGGNSRFMSIMRTFDNGFLESLMHIKYENFRQFMKKPVEINGRKVTPDMLKLSKFKWLITSTQAAMSRNRELANKRAFMMEILPMLAQLPNFKFKEEVAEFDLIQYIKEFMTKGGEKDVDRHIKVIPGAVPTPPMMPGAEVPQDEGAASALPSVPPTPNDARSELPPEPGY